MRVEQRGQRGRQVELRRSPASPAGAAAPCCSRGGRRRPGRTRAGAPSARGRPVASYPAALAGRRRRAAAAAAAAAAAPAAPCPAAARAPAAAAAAPASAAGTTAPTAATRPARRRPGSRWAAARPASQRSAVSYGEVRAQLMHGFPSATAGLTDASGMPARRSTASTAATCGLGAWAHRRAVLRRPRPCTLRRHARRAACDRAHDRLHDQGGDPSDAPPHGTRRRSARLRNRYGSSPWVIQAGRIAARPRPAIPGKKACPDDAGRKIA